MAELIKTGWFGQSEEDILEIELAPELAVDEIVLYLMDGYQC